MGRLGPQRDRLDRLAVAHDRGGLRIIGDDPLAAPRLAPALVQLLAQQGVAGDLGAAEAHLRVLDPHDAGIVGRQLERVADRHTHWDVGQRLTELVDEADLEGREWRARWSVRLDRRRAFGARRDQVGEIRHRWRIERRTRVRPPQDLPPAELDVHGDPLDDLAVIQPLCAEVVLAQGGP
jgi:hypothetical protein